MKGHVGLNLAHNPHVPWALVCTYQEERETFLHIPVALLSKSCTCRAAVTRGKSFSSFYKGTVETNDTPEGTYPK